MVIDITAQNNIQHITAQNNTQNITTQNNIQNITIISKILQLIIIFLDIISSKYIIYFATFCVKKFLNIIMMISFRIKSFYIL